VALAALDLTLLVTVFFFWASVHVIHQAAYVADVYRFKDPRGWSWTSRITWRSGRGSWSRGSCRHRRQRAALS